MKVVHITTVHQRDDARIFSKECVSLKDNGFDVALIVADGKGDEIKQGIKIYDIGIYSSRIKRLLFSSKKAIKKAKDIGGDIFHFHDPDLLIAIRSLKSKTNKVVFDSHEDFPILMYQRPYIPIYLRKIFFLYAKHTEKTTAKKIDAIVTATDTIRDKFVSYGVKNVVTVKNYPIIDFNQEDKTVNSHKSLPLIEREPKACYVGGLTKIRGVEQMINSCEKANIPLILVGPFDDATYFQQMQTLSGWKNVEYLGRLPHNELKEKVYDKATIGLNLLLDAPNHRDAIPIKQLEYMNAMLPVVTTSYINFCKQITKQTQCGIVVEPDDIEQTSMAIKYLMKNPQQAMNMGINGYKAVKEKYNWAIEKDNLLKLYTEELFKD